MFAVQLALTDPAAGVPPSLEAASEAVQRSAEAVCGEGHPVEFARAVRLAGHTVAVLFLVAQSEAEALLVAELIGRQAARALGGELAGVRPWEPRTPGPAAV